MQLLPGAPLFQTPEEGEVFQHEFRRASDGYRRAVIWALRCSTLSPQAKSSLGDEYTHLALKQYHREQALRELATVDELTGLNNKNGRNSELIKLTKAIKRSLSPHNKDQTPPNGPRHYIACVHIDLRGFKSINDTFGHTAGDACLKHFARILKTRLRPGDVIIRQGGDEFVLFLPLHSLGGVDGAVTHLTEIFTINKTVDITTGITEDESIDLRKVLEKTPWKTNVIPRMGISCISTKELDSMDNEEEIIRYFDKLYRQSDTNGILAGRKDSFAVLGSGDTIVEIPYTQALLE